jgi:sarcosine oxidase subunit alpha
VEVPGILPPAPGPFILGAESPPATLRRLSRFAALAPSAGLRLAAGLVQGVGVEGLAARLFPREGITLWGVPLLLRRAATAVVGDRAVAGIRVADLDAAGRVTGREEEWPLDVVVTSAGLAPLVELAQLAGVDVVEVPELGGHVPLCGPDGETRVPGVFVAGSATGVVGASVAVAQGRIAGLGICRELGLIPRGEATRELETARAALTEARRHALPFLPDVDGGLRRMAERWAASAR